ncbi:DUF4179 domain-containing protein [Bacillus sp. BGMRC 2118]|nr:DUF4179 domain-containing protein [Bacillus sp. BGMRC 2118]
MKQEYQDLLNLDIEQIEPTALTKKEKIKIKNHVLSKLVKKKSMNINYMAASIVLGAGILATSFLAVPAIANQVPFIENIIAYFDQDTVPQDYTEQAEVINQVQSSNGIDVMVENAVYDGTNIILTYALQTEVELGENPRTEGFINVEPSTGMGGTGTIEKINDTTYIGIEEVTPHFEGESPDDILVQWEPLAFTNHQAKNKVEGDWKFEFKLGQLQTDAQIVNETLSQEGITVLIKSVEQSKLTATFDYEMYVDTSVIEKWPFVSLEMVGVKDNLGNEYNVHGNGGTSQGNGALHELRSTIYSLNPDAKTLTLTPQVHYSKGSGEVLETKVLKPITIQLK